MKKAKNVLMITLAVALVFSVAMIPASAAEGYRSISVSAGAYSGTGTLTLTNFGATATINAKQGAGEVIPFPSVGVKGTVYLDNGDTLSLAAEKTGADDSILSCSSTRSSVYMTTNANCNYFINGGLVGYISLPEK